jgi:hypothetical protein
VERWEALRLALGARGNLAARGGYVNPASEGASQAPWRLPPLHPLARFARDWQTSDALRCENVETWLFETADQKLYKRIVILILRAGLLSIFEINRGKEDEAGASAGFCQARWFKE